MILMLSLIFLVSGCGDEENDQTDVILEPLLLDVPVIERGILSGSFDGEFINVRIVGGVLSIYGREFGSRVRGQSWPSSWGEESVVVATEF